MYIKIKFKSSTKNFEDFLAYIGIHKKGGVT